MSQLLRLQAQIRLLASHKAYALPSALYGVNSKPHLLCSACRFLQRTPSVCRISTSGPLCQNGGPKARPWVGETHLKKKKPKRLKALRGKPYTELIQVLEAWTKRLSVSAPEAEGDGRHTKPPDVDPTLSDSLTTGGGWGIHDATSLTLSQSTNPDSRQNSWGSVSPAARPFRDQTSEHHGLFEGEKREPEQSRSGMSETLSGSVPSVSESARGHVLGDKDTSVFSPWQADLERNVHGTSSGSERYSQTTSVFQDESLPSSSRTNLSAHDRAWNESIDSLQTLDSGRGVSGFSSDKVWAGSSVDTKVPKSEHSTLSENNLAHSSEAASSVSSKPSLSYFIEMHKGGKKPSLADFVKMHAMNASSSENQASGKSQTKKKHKNSKHVSLKKETSDPSPGPDFARLVVNSPTESAENFQPGVVEQYSAIDMKPVTLAEKLDLSHTSDFADMNQASSPSGTELQTAEKQMKSLKSKKKKQKKTSQTAEVGDGASKEVSETDQMPSADRRVQVSANILKSKAKAKKKAAGTKVSKAPTMSEVESAYKAEAGEAEVELLEEAEEMEDLLGQESAGSEATKDKKKAKGSNSEQHKKKVVTNPAKFIQMFNIELLAYVQACCFSGQLGHGQKALKFYNQLSKNGCQKASLRQVKDIAIYNTLMHGWAKQSKVEPIKELFGMMRSSGLQPSMQSYAACLECLGRLSPFPLAVAQRVLDDMHADGLPLEEIFNQCKFRQDEKHQVLQAIRQVMPDFSPHPPPQPAPYTGVLLEDLNQRCTQTGETNPYAGLMATEELHHRASTQLQWELSGSVSVKSISAQPSPSQETLAYRDKLAEVKKEWRSMLMDGFKKRLKMMARKNKGEYGLSLYPYLKLFEPAAYVDCMLKEMEEIATASEGFSPNVSFLCKRLGSRVHAVYTTQDKVSSKYVKKVQRLYSLYCGEYNNPDLASPSHRHAWMQLLFLNSDGASLDIAEKHWPMHVLKGLGKILHEIIVYDVKIDANLFKSTNERRMVTAFHPIYRSYGYRTFEEIKPHPVLMRLYQGANLSDLTFDPRELPMLVPPLPWCSINQGGYFLSSTRLIRLPELARAQVQKLETVPPENIAAVLDSLNTLSAAAWVINKPMLDVIISVFNSKGNPDLDIPAPISECPPLPKVSQSMTAAEKAAAHRERNQLRQQRSEMYSLWCNELYRLSIANMFRDEIFWFPHTMDFRGRTYPCPPHFNHLGGDLARSILLFARGKPLGAHGLDWLKIHLINLTGLKKRSSNAERLAFANEIMSDILDSADNPLTGRGWWQQSDEPWQTLACCMEIAQASRFPDPASFVSHLPIHQDGSCNGLQHYAALGRDQAGAESVNLHPFPVPMDVYSDVAELVEKERQKDAEAGNTLAEQLEGFVRRKVIKQTVMTTVYGVTRYGARHQILKQLKDIPDFPVEHQWAASLYLSDKTFHCLREMFTATKEIQDWLTLSAQLISTVCQKPVDWATPLGLPVIQPYHKVFTQAQNGVQITDAWNQFQKPNTMKQKNAFPPNFIHSLDSTHMMLTSLFCMRAGITFVSVHDCYWTHACDVAIMNKICREQFVSLHKQPILEDLSQHLVQAFAQTHSFPEDLDKVSLRKAQALLHSVLSQVPKRGTFDLENVLKSTYFFS